MAEGLALHIGNNDYCLYRNVDPLENSVNDAIAMHHLAYRQGFQALGTLLSRDATFKNVRCLISLAARRLNRGDFFLLTFAGHGFSGKHRRAPDPHQASVNWLLFDVPLWDFMLVDLLAEIKEGVNLILISDSCRSGGMLDETSVPGKGKGGRADVSATPIGKSGWPGIVAPIPTERAKTGVACFARMEKKIKANILYLAACQELQQAQVDGHYGAFTQCILETWACGGFQGTYRMFYYQLCSRLQKYPNQDPYLFSYPEDFQDRSPVFSF